MKQVWMFVFVLSTFAASANDRYTEAMTKAIGALYQAQDVPGFQAAVNTFERIGKAEAGRWEPNYYAAFGYIMMATRTPEPTGKDQWLDLAASACEKAGAISPNNDEIIALNGFVHMIRVTVDPATRGPQYSSLAIQEFAKASAINPNNPRALALTAQMQFGVADFFKQAPTEACATARKALAIFDSGIQPASAVAPAWGREMTAGLVKNCEGK